MDGQTIHADAPLRALLNITEADQVRVLNINKYLGHHCPLPGRRAPVAVAPSLVFDIYDEPMGRDLDRPEDHDHTT
jgi:hypothetical protein